MRNALPCCLWCWFSASPHTQFCFYLCMLVNHTLVTCLKYTHTVVIKMGLVNWFWYMMLMKQPKGICWKGEGGDNGESGLYEVWLTSYSEKFLQVLWCKPFNAGLILLTPLSGWMSGQWVMEFSRQLCGKMRRSSRKAQYSSAPTSTQGLEIHFYTPDVLQLEYSGGCYTAEQLCVEAAKKCCEYPTCGPVCQSQELQAPPVDLVSVWCWKPRVFIRHQCERTWQIISGLKNHFVISELSS